MVCVKARLSTTIETIQTGSHRPHLASNKKVGDLPAGAIKYTTDARDYTYKDRPDIGAYEYGAIVPKRLYAHH